MDHQVIIIGAGVAGLAAGQRLKSAGVEPLVIEARNRIGGRIWTDHTYGPVELGAEFIHGSQAATWQLITPAGLETEAWPRPAGIPRLFFQSSPPSADDPTAFTGDGQFLSEETSHQVIKLCNRIEQYRGPDQSVADVVAGWPDVNPTLVPFALDRLACMEAADVTRLSAQALAEERARYSAGWDNSHIRAGYDTLPRLLTDGLTIRLDAPVTEIRWDDASARLTLQDGQRLTTERLIITVPLGLLQAGMPRFEPALPPAKRQAIHALAMGPVTKLALWFKEVFWPPFEFLGTDGWVVTWWPTGSPEQPALMGYNGGPKALELAALGSAQAVEQGLREVARLFGAQAHDLFLAGRLVDWAADPWSRGGYSYTPTGAGDARGVLGQPVGRTLFFAGEATPTNGHQATVHGAIESGWRVAAEVMS